MERPARYKSKNKKQTPKKSPKKRKSDGPTTCSTFIAELSKKLASRRKQDNNSKNVVQMIIDSITNALPFKFSKRRSETKESHVEIEALQNLAPELIPNDVINIPPAAVENEDIEMVATTTAVDKTGFKIPKMPIVSSEVIKIAIEKRRKTIMQDVVVSTEPEPDMASELVKHVETLRKISLIAEEFNQKTARNLKEIVDSVQEDLIKKLEEIREEQKLQAEANAIKEEQQNDKNV